MVDAKWVESFDVSNVSVGYTKCGAFEPFHDQVPVGNYKRRSKEIKCHFDDKSEVDDSATRWKDVEREDDVERLGCALMMQIRRSCTPEKNPSSYGSSVRVCITLGEWSRDLSVL